MNEIKVNKEVDEIIEDNFNPDIKFKINRVKRWFTSNIFGRAFSYLVGWTGKSAIMLRCNTNGSLKVAIAGSAFENNDVYTGNSANAYVNVFSSLTLYSRIDIWITTNDVKIKRFNTLLAWDNEFTLNAGDYYSFDCVTAQLAIKDAVAGTHGTYKIIVWR